MAFPLRQVLVGAALALTLAVPAQAQFGAPIDERTTVVKGLVVKGFGGPPWWIVSRGEAKVYVLGAPNGVPPGLHNVTTHFFDRFATDFAGGWIQSLCCPAKHTPCQRRR